MLTWRPPCRHCRRNPVNRPRGLCYACFRDPAVRGLYPAKVNQFGGDDYELPRCSRCGCRRGAYHEEARLRPVCPTCLRPEPQRSAMAALLAVYEARADAGRPLFGAG